MVARVAVPAAAGCSLVLAIAGCGDDKAAKSGAKTATVTATASPRAREARIAAGQRVLASSGCLACHQLGTRGASGPGNNLTGIGERRSATALLRALVNPTRPMPSFRKLGSARLDDLVAFLSELHRDARGAPACRDDVDCG